MIPLSYQPPSFTVVQQCRMCNDPVLQPAFALPETPLANAYQTKYQAPDDFGASMRAPLTVMVCDCCQHSQLREAVPGAPLFSRYLYTTGTSASFRAHFEEYAAWLREEVSSTLPQPPSVLEVGSNDGTFLRALRKQDFVVLGIEPAGNLVDSYHTTDAPMMQGTFNLDFARRWRLNDGKLFDVVVGNNVFAHVESLSEAMQALSFLTHPESLFAAEVQYLPDLFRAGAFDMVYHEHRDYHTLGPWETLLYRYGWRLVHALRVPTHGGSVRFVARRGNNRVASGPLAELLSDETHHLDVMAEWTKLQAHVAKTKVALREALAPYKRVAVYGASAKLTTLAAALGLDELGSIAYVVDDAPTKQGLFTPNGKWRILSSMALRDVNLEPDAILIGAWNVKKDILHRLRSGGITTPCIVPFPAVEVV